MNTTKFVFDGKSTEDMDLVIQTPPVYEFPERDVTKTHVPGLSGDIVIDNNSYKNVKRTYSVAKLYKPYSNVASNGEQILKWLTSSYGQYKRLEDDYDPTVFRMASFSNSGSFNDIFKQALTFEITFDCKPQRYLKTGENEYAANPIQNGKWQFDNATENIALPLIKIKNIPIDNADADVTLLSVKDNENKVKSIITLSNLDNQEAFIDSQEQTVTDRSGSITNKVNLNNKEFPKLSGPHNILEIAQYKNQRYEIEKYRNILDDSASMSMSQYMPYENIVAAKQGKITITPYETLVTNKQDIFTAESYQSLVEGYCDAGVLGYDENQQTGETRTFVIAGTHEFESPDNILNSVSESFSLNVQFIVEHLNAAQSRVDPEFLPDWLEVISGYSGVINRYFDVRVKYDVITQQPVRGFFNHNFDVKADTYETLGTNSWIYHEGEPTATPMSVKNTIFRLYEDDEKMNQNDYTISFIPCDENKVPDIPEDTLPDWLTFTISTTLMQLSYGDSSPDRLECLNVFQYKLATKGYIFTPKAFLSKAKWKLLEANTILYRFGWNSISSKFIKTSSFILRLSFNSSINHKFLKYAGVGVKPYIQYDNDLIEVYSIDDELEKFTIKCNEAGLYAVGSASDNTDISKWKECSTGSYLLQNFSTTDSFVVRYLKSIPDYSGETDWPSWLDTKAYTTSGTTDTKDLLNAQVIQLKVLKTAYYRNTYYEGTEEKTSYWALLPVGSWLKENKTDGPVGDNYPICHIKNNESITVMEYIPPLPDKYFNDRCYTNQYEFTIDTPPDWLVVKYEINTDMGIMFRDNEANGDIIFGDSVYFKWHNFDEDENETIVYSKDEWYPNVDKKLYQPEYEDDEIVAFSEVGLALDLPYVKYYAGQTGLFKFNNNFNWQRYAIDELIITTEYTADTTFYYLEGTPLPVYPYPVFVEIEPIQDQLTGNPVSVEMKALQSGYYRVNNSVYWEYYEAGQLITRVSVGADTIINYLLELPDVDFSETQIIITPRWWKL